MSPRHTLALQHHFENMEQQREAGTLGMWVFLVTEIMFFGGMFLAYTLYRTKFPAAFASASNHLDHHARRDQHGRADSEQFHDGAWLFISRRLASDATRSFV